MPKASSGLDFDLDDREARSIGAKNGLVDVKVCSMDAAWSGLKRVRRVEDRQTTPWPSAAREWF